MADKKVEVNLEMCSGFFRIPTDEIIYNITVLASSDASAGKVIEKIIEVEKIVEVEKPVPAQPTAIAAPMPSDDGYYRLCAQKMRQGLAEIDTLAQSGPSGESPAGAIRDLGEMANDLKTVLRGAMNCTPQSSGGSGGAPGLIPALERLSEKIAQALSLCPAGAESPPVQPAAAPATKSITRYLFNLDAVFQTVYELCTNETVKAHIQTARAKAEELFDKNGFYDAISPKVVGYAEDDGFLNVPMSDVFTALGSVCSDKGICNLLAKMDKQQSSIFLDQFLPLEVPPTEEIAMADDSAALDLGADEALGASPSANGLPSLLRECQTALDTLIYQSAGQENAAGAGGNDLGARLEEAMIIAATIHHDAARLADQGSASGQDDRLGDTIKGLATLAETLIDMKATREGLSYEEALVAGQEAAQRAIDALAASRKVNSPPAATPPPPNSPEPKEENAAPSGEASQDDIDRLLEELG